MNVVRSEEQLHRYLKEAADVSKDHPVVITKFIEVRTHNSFASRSLFFRGILAMLWTATCADGCVICFACVVCVVCVVCVGCRTRERLRLTPLHKRGSWLPTPLPSTWSRPVSTLVTPHSFCRRRCVLDGRLHGCSAKIRFTHLTHLTHFTHVQNMTQQEYEGVLEAGRTIAKVLNISGPFNCQFILTADGAIKVGQSMLWRWGSGSGFEFGGGGTLLLLLHPSSLLVSRRPIF